MKRTVVARQGASPQAGFLVVLMVLLITLAWQDVVRTGRVDRERGQVVDAGGRPVAGARVWLVPERHTLTALGIDDKLAMETWARTETDAQGQFALSAERLRDRSTVTTSSYPSRPWLIVLHPDYAPVWIECEDAPAAARETDAAQAREIVLPVRAARLSGRVVDDAGQPVSGARVRVKEWDSWQHEPNDVWSGGLGGTQGVLAEATRTLQEAVTDASGAFAIEGLKPVRSAARIVKPDGVALILQDVALAEGGELAAGDIALPAGHGLRGSVRDTAGNPVPGAEIVVVNGAHELPEQHLAQHGWTRLTRQSAPLSPQFQSVRTAMSASDGTFVLEGLTSPTVVLGVAATGFEPLLLPAVTVGAEPVSCTLQPSGDLTLQVVRSEDGQAVPDARLVRGAPEHLFHWRMPADSSIVDLQAVNDPAAPTGWLRLRGACELPLTIVLAAAGRATTMFQIRADAGRAGLPCRVELPAECRVTGRVVDDSGAPQAGVLVNAGSGRGWPYDAWQGLPASAGPIVTADDGSFALTSLGGGTWTLDLEGRERPAYRVEVELTAGGTRALGEITLPQAGRIQGRATEIDGTPAGAVEIKARLQRRGHSENDCHTTTAPDGSFVLEDLAPGPWLLQASTLPIGGGNGWVPVDVMPGGAHDVAVRVVRGPRVRGRVLFRGAPVPGAIIAIRSVDDSGRLSSPGETFSTDDTIPAAAADGSFRVEHWRDDPFEVKAITPWGGSSRSVFVAGGWNSVENLELVLGSSELAGRVVDVDGQPLPDIDVRLLGEWEGLLCPLQRTDVTGAFRFEGLWRGEYRLRCSSATHEFAETESGPYTVPEAACRTDLIVPLERGATIRGTARLADGRPVPDGLAVVLVQGEDSWPLPATRTRSGRFAFGCVAPGSYEVGISRGVIHGGGDSVWSIITVVVPVRVGPGESRDVELSLPP